MDERPAPPPEGRLIAAALSDSGLSIREAAKQAGISYGRWRQITSGYQNVSPGSFARVRAPARTLAKMASVVRVSPGQLEDAGRTDAAEILRKITRKEDTTGTIENLGAIESSLGPPGSYQGAEGDDEAERVIRDKLPNDPELARALIALIRAVTSHGGGDGGGSPQAQNPGGGRPAAL